MWKHKLRKKKIQFFLVGLILFFASAIFIGCFSFTLEINRFANSYYSKSNSPDMFVNIAQGQAANELLAQARANPNFIEVDTVNGFLGNVSGDTISLRGRDISPQYFNLFAPQDVHTLPWKVTAKETLPKSPKAGEIWVTHVLADQEGIHQGDTIILHDTADISLRVSAIVDDATCASGAFGIYPFYVSQGTLDRLSPQYASRMLTIRSNLPIDETENWLDNRSPSIIQNVYLKFDISQLKLNFSMLTIFGGVGMLAAAIIFIVSIIIIRFLVKNNLTKEYRSIGIYKALGYTNAQIIGFYLGCYALVGIIGLALGALAGLPLSYALGASMTRYVQGFGLTDVSIVVALGGAVVLFALLMFSVWLAHTRVKSITPVQALQIGLRSSPKKLTRSLLRHASSPLATAVNDLGKNPAYTALFATILAVGFYLCMFFVGISNSFSHMTNQTDVWMGLPKADAYVGGKLTPETLEQVQNDPAVRKSVYGTMVQDAPVKINGRTYGLNLNSNIAVVWSDFTGSAFFRPCKVGRHPQSADEIAISNGYARGTSLRVGDYLSLTLNGHERAYLVTGIYDSLMHGYKSMEMIPQALSENGVSLRTDTVAVKLRDPGDYTAFANRMKQLPNLTVGREAGVVKSVSGITQLIQPVTTVLVTIFILFSLLNIINLLLTSQIDNRRKYGILKALGFTNTYIGLQNLFKVLLPSLLGAAIALVLYVALSPQLFYAALRIYGFVYSIPQTAALLGIIFAFIVGLALLFNIPLRRISPVELMDE